MEATRIIAKVLEGTDPRALVNVLAEAEGKQLDRLPGNTEVHADGQWSEWDGKLVMVYGPDYYSINKDAQPELFDPAMMARRYTVRFATDGRHRIGVPDKSFLGLGVDVANHSAQYWQTIWVMKKGYMQIAQGTFEKEVEHFWVGVKMKDLGPAEVRMVMQLYNSWGYHDVGGYRDMNLPIGDWKKIIAHHKFTETQDLPSELANAAYKLLIRANGNKDPRDERDEQIVWESIQGIYKTTKGGIGLAFILRK